MWKTFSEYSLAPPARFDILSHLAMHLFPIRLLLIVSADSIAEFSFETNASPSGGHLESDRLSATAGVDELRLQSLGWTDDVDDFPLTHSFGYLHGYQEYIAIGR